MGQPVKITIVKGAEPGREIAIDREMLLGRAEPADILIVDPRVSGRHALLRPGDHAPMIEDVGSSNGTFVNGQQITGPHTLTSGDEIQVGDTKLRVEGAPVQATTVGEINGWNLTVRTGPDAGLVHALREGEQLFIGRDASAQIALTDSRVSTQHAAVQLLNGHATVRDVGSANGTLLNGSPVTGSTSLTAGSEIQVGETVIVATMGAPVAGGPTPTVIGVIPKELSSTPPAPPRSRKALVGASLASALVIAGGITAGAFVLKGSDDDKTLTTAEVVRANRNATVLILSRQNGEPSSSGSGFVVDAKQGLIVTNNHVATGGELTVQPEAARSRQVPAKIVAALPCEDLALIQIEDTDARAAIRQVTFAQTPFEQGDAVTALGYPGSAEGGRDFGRDSLSTTSGVVSKVDARYDAPRSGVPLLTSVVQHTAAVNPGNSGGPLFDDAGELVGVNTAIFGRGGQRLEGESYAVSIKRLRERLEVLRRGDSQKWLGLSFGGTAVTNDNQEVGLEINGITPDSPADKAGIANGSILVAVDGKPVVDVVDYCEVVPEKEGDDVTLTIGTPGVGVTEVSVEVGSDG